MKKFDTRVQEIKNRVLKEVAIHSFEEKDETDLLKIPEKIASGKVSSMRCCVYKERAIINERIKIAISGGKNSLHTIVPVPIACDECPSNGYTILRNCRGCIAHRCAEACPRNAITFNEKHVAFINKDLCINCGRCANVCPYMAIANYLRPCQKACKCDAISFDEEKNVVINYDKCISCGNCVYQCPWGAISDVSDITNCIEYLKHKDDKKVNAIIAPSISSQFSNAKVSQVVTAIKKLGFDEVYEAALGADIVAIKESKELIEKGFLISSCCPSFVDYVKKNFPDLACHISTTLSPMATVAKELKKRDSNCINIFIGPCTSKKEEIKLDTVTDYIDSVITFEELQALFDSKEFDLSKMEETPLTDASYFGRIFARSCGLSDAISNALYEQKIDYDLKVVVCDGIEQCKNALLKKRAGVLDANFIEGMICQGGCIGGPGCTTHEIKDKLEVDEYGKQAKRSVFDAVNSFMNK